MSLFLPDANVLIHALRHHSPDHAVCRQWLADTCARGDEIGLAERAETALPRIPTLRKLHLVPIQEVLGFWKEDLWGYSGTRRLSPGNDHANTFSLFITELGLSGNDVNDAWLAALAIEQRATLVSTDTGFARFSQLRWLNPASKSPN